MSSSSTGGITYWLLTGWKASTNGTQDVIREHLRGLPGELVERPWVDFAHNRSEALDFARGRADYLLVIDADETLEISEGFEMPRLSADSYNIEVRCGSFTCARKQLLRNSLPWRYEGVVHEYACCHEARSEEFLPGLWIASYRDGARARDPQTYLRDAETLERALRAEPNSARYVFYLAQTYLLINDFDLALRYYRRRVEMGGQNDEVWYSLYQIAQLEEAKKPWPEAMEQYLTAYEFMAISGLRRRLRPTLPDPVRSRARMQRPAGWVANNREDRIAEAAAREPGCMYERLAEAVYGRRGWDFFHPAHQPSAEEDR